MQRSLLRKRHRWRQQRPLVKETSQEVRTEGTPVSPVTCAAARAAESTEPAEGVQPEEAEETESSATDEVIDLDVSHEASPAHTASLPSESARAVASDGLKSNGDHPRDRLLVFFNC